jgi:hypothetical protein
MKSNFQRNKILKSGAEKIFNIKKNDLKNKIKLTWANPSDTIYIMRS